MSVRAHGNMSQHNATTVLPFQILMRVVGKRRKQKNRWRTFVLAGLLAAVLGLGVAYLAIQGTFSQNFCKTFESYDWNGGYCYATCDTDTECAKLDEKYAKSDAALTAEEKRSYFAFYTDLIITPPGGFVPAEGTTYTTYAIENDKLGETLYASSTPQIRWQDEHTWQLIYSIAPSAALRKITQFTGYTDYVGQTGAQVGSLDEANRTWDMSVNDAGFYTERLTIWDRGSAIHTLVHELGHVLTLGNSFTENPINCRNFTMHEGCVRADSIVAQFAEQFWPDVHKLGGDVSASYVDGVFVTSYAAVSLAEDMAESWTAFVLLDKPTGITIADKKVLFFYKYPSYISARAEILKHLGHVH